MINFGIIDDYFKSKIIISHLEKRIINILENQGPLNRRQLVRQLNIPRTTVFDNLKKLQKRNIIKKFAKYNGKRGRPLIYWKLSEW